MITFLVFLLVVHVSDALSVNNWNAPALAENDDQRSSRSRVREGVECTDGLYYCGMELWVRGFTNVESNHSLYYCDKGKYGEYQSECAVCWPGMPSSFCICIPDRMYCGYELLNRNMRADSFRLGKFKEQATYLCDSSGFSFTEIATCAKSCFPGLLILPATCSRKDPPTCISNQLYCGKELQLLAYKNAKAETLYRCNEDGDSTFVERCRNGCEISPAGISRCVTTKKYAYLP